MAKKSTKKSEASIQDDRKVVPMKPVAKNAAPAAATSKPKKKASAPKKAPVKKVALKAGPAKTKTASIQTNIWSYKPLNPFQSYMETIMTKNPIQFDQIAQEATAAGRENLEALQKSCGILAKGYESIMRASMELSQSAAEKQASYAKEAMSCKTLNEFAEMQNKVAQANFDDFMSSMTKISEMSAKVITESVEPINEQMTKAAEKVSKAA